MKLHLKCWRYVVKCRVKYSDYKIDYLPLFLHYYAYFIFILVFLGLKYVCYNFVISIGFTTTEYAIVVKLLMLLLYLVLFIPIANHCFWVYLKRIKNIVDYLHNRKDKDIKMIVELHRYE